MNFIFKPSLQHIAIVKIVTTLMTHDDIKAIVEDKNRRKQAKIENQLIKKVKTITLPVFLESEVLGAIKPIFDEIHVWRDYHRNYHTTFLSLTDITDFVKYHKLVWTSQGTVDKKKTAEMFIRIEEIDLDWRFRLACRYCLDKDIQTLWNQMTDDLKQWYYSLHEIEELDLVFKLVTTGNTGLNELISHERSESEQYQYEFLNAVSQRNAVATEYFWNKLESQQKEECLVRATELAVKDPFWGPEDGMYDEYYLGETLCFLLSQMTDKQQIEIFQICPYVLNSLLEWPRQNLFLETLQRTCHFLKEYDYRLLVFQKIIDKIIMQYTDCNYLEIFEECWKQSTAAQKKFVFNDHTGLCLLFRLFQIKDKNCIELVLKDATAEEKNSLICSQSNLIYQLLFAAEEWDLLEIFMRECIPSKDEMTTPIKCPYKDSITLCTEFFLSVLESERIGIQNYNSRVNVEVNNGSSE